MAVDLSDYLDSFQYEISPPGTNLYTNMTTDEAVGRLSDSFWECRMDGFLVFDQYTCDDTGIITPYNASTPDLGREFIQVLILLAGYRVVLTSYQNLNAVVIARAGSVESEVQKSAQVLMGVLKALTSKIDIVLTRMSDLGSTTVAVLDSVIDNTESIVNGSTWFVRGW